MTTETPDIIAAREVATPDSDEQYDAIVTDPDATTYEIWSEYIAARRAQKGY